MWLSTWRIASITFLLAYIAGFAMTVGTLVQEGGALRQALSDTFYSETASITVMEILAIGTDIWLAGDAPMVEPLFWSSLVFSLSIGLIAAYPVKVVLIRYGHVQSPNGRVHVSQWQEYCDAMSRSLV